MNRVSDGDRLTLQSFLSYVGTLTVLFRYVGHGTQLAPCHVSRLTSREFVTPVPD